MTRIIGGSAGGRRLRTPPGAGTRPTSDRVREALFSSLDSALGSLEGLEFLDLYAGSGAVALEAASRGARPVTAVEQDRRVAALVGQNAGSLGLDVTVVTAPVARFLATAEPAPCSVVFADPPYSLPDADVRADLRLLGSKGWLAAGALVVVERSSRSRLSGWPDGFEAVRQRAYGETVLAYATWTGRGTGLWYGHGDPDGSGTGGSPVEDEES